MTRRPSTRAAFTLIELLVVISIIGVLLALLLPAVQKIRGTGPKVVAKNDITQLDDACTQFKNKFKFYPPTVFRIPATYQFNTPGHADYAGCAIFQRMFDRWGRGQADGLPTGIPNGGTVLVGSQSLVYFLGGPDGTGWAIDAPIAPSSGAAAKNIFMDFPQTKLSPQRAFLDPWGTPYAYFASEPGGNYAVVRFDATTPGYTTGNFDPVPPPGAAYPPGVPSLHPLRFGGKPMNQGRVQILSAGENKVFGPGSPPINPPGTFAEWISGINRYSTSLPGADDIANFNEGRQLGSQ